MSRRACLEDASAPAARDAYPSARAERDASPLEPRRLCAWCGVALSSSLRIDARHCGQRCRQASHRFGAGAVARRRATEPLRLAYADPPYPGLAHRYYSEHPDYAGEVDHGALLSRLRGFDGWALSTSARALPQVLAACVAQDLAVRVASWHRGVRRVRSAAPLSGWEPVVYAGGRRVVSDVATSDVLELVSRPRLTDPARVIGAKPAGFAYWLFALLGALPGDRFKDLYPGSGGVARAWAVYVSRSARADGCEAGRGCVGESGGYQGPPSRRQVDGAGDPPAETETTTERGGM